MSRDPVDGPGKPASAAARVRAAQSGKPIRASKAARLTVEAMSREIVSLRKTIKALRNPNRCPNCHVVYTPKTCTNPCDGPGGGAYMCKYPKCVGK